MTEKGEQADLAALEAQVDDLIKTVQRLSMENSALLSQQDNLVTERAKLMQKTEQARSRIESMIARLKSMEASS